MLKYPDRKFAATYEKQLGIVIDREKSKIQHLVRNVPSFLWQNQESTVRFKDAQARLSYIADLGFDVLYLPPIHPIGTTFRKGKNQLYRNRARRCGGMLGHWFP